MKVSHVLYKVNNLEASIKEFESKGFKVEYGSKSKPHNALIYFSEGPYIELLHKAPLPFYIKLILKLMGQGKVIDRLESWEQKKEGFFGLCLENYDTNFKAEEAILKKYEQGFFVTKSSRTDPSNRTLNWKLLFPHSLRLPFLMTYFDTDPKPKNFTHSNGIKRIKHISFGTNADLIPIINELCEDEILELFVGNGVRDVSYGKQHLS